MAWQTSWGASRRTKFANTKITETNGVQWDSKKEYAYSRQLILMVRGGAIKDWKAKPKFTLKGLSGNTVCQIIPDFLVTLPDGTVEVHEVKSSATKTRAWSIKHKLWQDNYPHIAYKIVE